MIKAFFNSRTPTCTPTRAITLSSIYIIASLILSSGMLIPFHKKNGTKPFVLPYYYSQQVEHCSLD